MPPRSQQHAGLIRGALQYRPDSPGLYVDRNAIICSLGVLIGRDRDRNIVVLTLAQRLALALTHTNYRVGLAIHANLFAYRVSIWHQVVDDVIADNGYPRSVLIVSGDEAAAQHDI